MEIPKVKKSEEFHVVRLQRPVYEAFVAKLKADFDLTPPTQAVNTVIWKFAQGLLKDSKQLEEVVAALKAELLAEFGVKRGEVYKPDAIRFRPRKGAGAAGEGSAPGKQSANER
jgi:hypothetical protein